MANIYPIKNKEGEITAYRIRVLRYTDEKGNKHFYTKNWKIPPTYKTEKAIQKAVEKVAGEFETQCKRGEISTDSRTFTEYAKYYIKLCERDHKPATIAFYNHLLPLFENDIGTIKLKNLTPEHLNRFYLKLQTEDVKRDAKATGKAKLLKLREKCGKLQKELSAETGISEQALRNAFRQNTVSIKTAQKLSQYFDCPLDELFTVATSGKGLSPKYIRHTHNFIHAVLEKAMREGCVSQNIADRVTPPKMDKHEAEFFELEEILKIKEALDEEPFKYRVATYLLMETGIRRGELLGVRWKSVDFKARTIRIENNIVYTEGYGLNANTPKSGDFRTVSISPELIPILKDYKKYQRQQAKIKFSYIENDIERMKELENYNPEGYLFTQDSGKVMTPNSINQWMVNFSKKLGLHIHPHKFRHSQASLLYANNIDIVTISKRLGHKQVSTTQNIYAHMMEKSDRQASDTISNLLYKKAK